jgi:hypothetical protein
MNKVKLALTVVTILITVGPLLGVVYVYRDNLMGIVMPPELTNMLTPDQESGQMNMQVFAPTDNPTYDETTGHFDYPFNFTNPTSTAFSVDALSADIYAQNGEKLGTISLAQSVSIGPGETVPVDITGTLNPNLVNQYQSSGFNDISIQNLDVTVGGVTLHIDSLNDIFGGNN